MIAKKIHNSQCIYNEVLLNSMFIVPCACDVFIFTCNVTSVYPCSHCLCRLIRCHAITHLLPLSNNHAFRGVQ